MKIEVVFVVRNDGYGGKLESRATYCLNSAINTFDSVHLIDWNSERPLLWDIENDIKFEGNLKHYVINPDIAKQLTGDDPFAQKCCEVLARNIGLRRMNSDFMVSSNIDVIAPRRQDLEDAINKMDEKTFYTISRRDVTWDQINIINSLMPMFTPPIPEWMYLRDELINVSKERHYEEKVTSGDDFSLINCSGDFQIAHKSVWNEIRGFEESLIYPLYADTNVQKKAVMHGFGLKALYEPAFFHIEHAGGGGGFVSGINKKANNFQEAIVNAGKTKNREQWGFSDIEIEYETY